ncbi:MAG: FAD:protein FMN transferase [Bacteroidales bacterium]|nr:FAD:protein FMN transferase [Bacteroidales bacterium]
MLLASSCKHSSTYIRLTGLAQGSTYLITYSETDEKGVSIAATATEVQERIDAGFERINNSVSGYHQGSTLSRINRNESTQTDSIFRDLFRISQQIWKETDGLFDPSGAPLYDLWGFGFQQRAMISTHQIDSLQEFIGMDKFRLDGEQLIKTNPNARLNFNAIAQGYTCDYIARILDSLHIQNYLIEVGGEVYAKGVNAQEKAWRIGIDRPEDGNNQPGAQLQEIVNISNQGLVTSGNYRKFYVENGKKYAHTIHPKTGEPVQHNLLSATILATNATLADAYATYCMVLGLEASVEFLSSRPDLQGYLIYSEGDAMLTVVAQ